MAKDQLARAVARVRHEEQTDQVASTSALPTEPVMFDPQQNKEELEAEYHERMRIKKAEDQERLRQHLIRLNAEEAEKKAAEEKARQDAQALATSTPETTQSSRKTRSTSRGSPLRVFGSSFP